MVCIVPKTVCFGSRDPLLDSNVYIRLFRGQPSRSLVPVDGRKLQLVPFISFIVERRTNINVSVISSRNNRLIIYESLLDLKFKILYWIWNFLNVFYSFQWWILLIFLHFEQISWTNITARKCYFYSVRASQLLII